MSTIKLLRHFDKIHSSGELTGSMDVATSTRGKEKSQIFSQFYSNDFDGYHILSSRSQRCTELVDVMKQHNDIASITVLRSLIERDYHIFQGLPKKQVLEELTRRFPLLAQQYNDNLSARLDRELYDEQGELLFEPTHKLRKRIIQELFYQFAKLEGQNILFVGHTGTIRALLTSFMDISNSDLDSYLAQVDGRAHIIYGALQVIRNGKVQAINHIPQELQHALGYRF